MSMSEMPISASSWIPNPEYTDSIKVFNSYIEAENYAKNKDISYVSEVIAIVNYINYTKVRYVINNDRSLSRIDPE